MAKDNAGNSAKKLVSRREFLVGSGAVMAAIALTACGSKTTSSTTTIPTSGASTSTQQTLNTPSTSTLTPKYGGTLRYIGVPGPATIGWPPEGVAGASRFTMYCAETLVQEDLKGNIVPLLAESYKVTDDKKSITFNLRKGIKFHDGSDFNAAVAKWNLDSMIDAKLESNWASVDIIDDYTIRVNLTQWLSTIPSSFGGSTAVTALMVSKAAFDKNGIDWVRKNPIGTGPFKFDSFIPDVSFKAVRNPNYWMTGKPYLDGVELILVADSVTQAMLMKTDGADVLDLAGPKDQADFIAHGLKVDSLVDANAVLVPDTANADSPWANQKVREAIEYAIDREGIAKALGYGYWKAPYQIPPSYSLIYDPNFPLARKYDVNKAQQLLDEAGYTGNPRFETTIIVLMGTDRNAAVSIQASLDKVGIKVNLDFPDMAKSINYMNPMGTWNNAAIFTPMGSGDVLVLGGLQFAHNVFGKSWARPHEFDQAFTAALSGLTPDAQKIRAAFDSLSEVASLIPVYEAVTFVTQRPEVFPKFIETRGTYCRDTWLNK